MRSDAPRSRAPPEAPGRRRTGRALSRRTRRYTVAPSRAESLCFRFCGRPRVLRPPSHAERSAMPRDVILTPDGLTKLKDELEYLSTEKRREVAARIKEAREFGDISENAEYDDAKNEQAMLEAKIAQLEERLRAATVIDAKDLGTDVVGIGSIVHVKDQRTSGSRDVHDRRLRRGQPGRAQALERVARRQGADRPQAQRDRRRSRCPNGKKRKLKITKIDVGAEVAFGRDGRPRRRPPPDDAPSCSPRGGRKLERLREDGRRPVPARVPGRRAEIAAVRAAHADLEAGAETDARLPRRRPPRRAPRARARRRSWTSSTAPGRIQLHARVDVLGARALRAPARARPRRPDRRRRRRVPLAPRRAVAARRATGRCSPSRCARRRTSTTACRTSRRASASASST